MAEGRSSNAGGAQQWRGLGQLPVQRLSRRAAGRRRRVLRAVAWATALLAWVTILTPSYLEAAPQAEAWPRWQEHDSESTTTVDHGLWDTLLGRYLQPAGDGQPSLFDYAALKDRDRAQIDAYVAALQEVPVSTLNRDEQLAYWVNLYNAATVQLIVHHYPVRSIRDIRLGGIFSSGPWDDQFLRVEGEAVSLDDIEHRILRPLWQDPRIHYGVNCASIGCPNLQPQAFTAANSDELLDTGAADYINSARGVRFAGGRMIVSSIYTWFAADFGGTTDGLRRHLAAYARPELAAEIQTFSGRIAYEYDWSLNNSR